MMACGLIWILGRKAKGNHGFAAIPILKKEIPSDADKSRCGLPARAERDLQQGQQIFCYAQVFVGLVVWLFTFALAYED